MNKLIDIEKSGAAVVIFYCSIFDRSVNTGNGNCENEKKTEKVEMQLMEELRGITMFKSGVTLKFTDIHLKLHLTNKKQVDKIAGIAEIKGFPSMQIIYFFEEVELKHKIKNK